MTNQGKKYFAFISYQRRDSKWAEWLRRKLEHYRLPSNLRKQDPSLPKEIRPVFRDVLELSSGLLSEEIREALKESRYLIVICSPHSAGSPWVDKEVQTFIELGRARDIIPFIVDGEPCTGDSDTECFTPALRSLKDEDELLGININEMGRDAAAVKVVAKMFGLKFDTLWQRYQRERKRRLFFTLGLILLALATGLYLIRLNRTVAGQNEIITRYKDQIHSLTDKWIELIQEDSTLFQEKSREIREALKEGSLGLVDVSTVMSYSNVSIVDSMDVLEVDEGIYELDGLRFVTDNPSDDLLKEWAHDSFSTCQSLILGKLDRFTVPQLMVLTEPCLVYLILKSRSLKSDHQKQEWFDLYNLMDDDEVMRLYDILYREQYKLASIELKYEKKDADLAQRYSEVISEYQGLRSLARKYPKNFYDLYVELQDTILDLYLRSYRGERGTIAYENLLSEALDDSEVFYRKNRSRKSRLVSMRLLTGAFKLNKEQIDEALALFESAYRLDRDTSAPYLARGYNSLAYRFAYDEDYASALETIDKAIRLQPSEANYYDSKGEILLMMDDWDGALEMWDKVLEVDPEFLSRYKNGTDFYHQLTRMGLIE